MCSWCFAAKTEFSDFYYGAGELWGSGMKFYIQGYEDPASSVTKPAYFHLPGYGEPFWVSARKKYADFMYDKGYVAASMGYYNKQECKSYCYDNAPGRNCSIGAADQPSMKSRAIQIKSGISKLCERTTVDCAKGVAVSGFSLGATMSQFVAFVDPRITATFAFGTGKKNSMVLSADVPANQMNMVDYSCLEDTFMNQYLSKTKRRFLNGYNDGLFKNGSPMFGMKEISGYDCGTSYDCIQEDGSGWFIIQDSDFTQADRDAYLFAAFEAMGGHYPTVNFMPMNATTAWLPSYESGNLKWSMPVIFTWLAGAANVTSAYPTPAPPTTAPLTASGASGKHGVVGMCVMILTVFWMA
jgi:hypothetical protein